MTRDLSGIFLGSLPMSKRQWCTLLRCLVFVLTLIGVNSQQIGVFNGCEIQFTVDEAQSVLSLSGRVVKPFSIDFSMPNEDVISQGLGGKVFGTLDGPCPANAQELVDSLYSGDVTLRTVGSLLGYYPSNVTVRLHCMLYECPFFIYDNVNMGV